MKSEAHFSECGKYRYLLTRSWDDALPILWVCMLNPSTADQKKNDPTVTTLIRFAKSWGFGGLRIVNLFAFISRYPCELKFELKNSQIKKCAKNSSRATEEHIGDFCDQETLP